MAAGRGAAGSQGCSTLHPTRPTRAAVCSTPICPLQGSPCSQPPARAPTETLFLLGKPDASPVPAPHREPGKAVGATLRPSLRSPECPRGAVLGLRRRPSQRHRHRWKKSFALGLGSFSRRHDLITERQVSQNKGQQQTLRQICSCRCGSVSKINKE